MTNFLDLDKYHSFFRIIPRTLLPLYAVITGFMIFHADVLS